MANDATTIGQKLRQARLNKNISLDELQQITKVQKRYLEAIELDDFEALPGKFYAKAFIRQYAQAVEEDGDKLVNVLEGKDSLEPPLPKRPQPEQVKGSRKALHVEEHEESFVVRHLPMIAMGVIALLIVGFVAYMTWQDRQAAPMITETSLTVEGSLATSSSQEQSSSTSSEASSESSSQASSSSAEEMAISMDKNTQSLATMSITQASAPVELTFDATDGSCWVGVVVGGGYSFQQTLQAGETQTTTLPENTQAAEIVLGASGNVEIKVNDQPLDFVGDYEALRKNIDLSISYK
ncbi:MAG: RodZ domain-containing protein [Enterococcus sp.]